MHSESEEAWQGRDRQLTGKIDDLNKQRSLLESIVGVDSDRAWEIRHRLYPTYTGLVIKELAGLDSEQSYDMRLQLNEALTGARLMSSLAGVDTDWAWAIRDQLRKHDRDDDVRTSILGVGYMSPWVTSQNRYPWIKAI